MTDETQFRPRLASARPPQGASDVSGSLISLELVDDDYNDDLHFGALRADSLSVSVDAGTGGFEAIIKDGETQSDATGRRFSTVVVPRIAPTGGCLTGTTLTGRFRQRTAIWYLPSEFFADGQEIGVRVCVSDRYGYELDETYYFTMRAWQGFEWPQFSLWTENEAGPLSVVPFLWYSRGATSDISLKLYWGKDSSICLDLDDAALAVEHSDTNGQGKEIVENGYCLFKEAADDEWQALSADSDIHLGNFPTGAEKEITLRLAVPEGASTEGQVLSTLSLTPIRASLCGTRMCGSELTGGSRGRLITAKRPDYRFYIYASVMSPDTRNYFENHFIGPLSE